MEIPLPVALAVLGAALLHAGWNAFLKSGEDKQLDAIGIAVGSGAVALVAAPFAGLPGDIVSRLNGELQKALGLTDVRKRLAADAAEPIGGSPAELQEFMRADFEKWKKVIDQAGVRGK